MSMPVNDEYEPENRLLDTSREGGNDTISSTSPAPISQLLARRVER